MTLLLIVGTAWAALAAPVALVIGRSVRLADLQEAATSPVVSDFVPQTWTLPAGSH